VSSFFRASDRPRHSTATALDASAVGLSALCLAHCLALPVLALALPALSAWAEAEWIHVALLLVAVPIAAMAFVDLRSGRPHSWSMLGLAALGLALMLAGALEFPNHDWERPLTLLGGLMLAGAHIANWRRRHARSHAA
jgi:hypothetical protein